MTTTIDVIKTHVRRNPGCTYTDITAATGAPDGTVAGALSKLFERGHVHRQKKGRRFHYFINAAPLAKPAKPIDTDAVDAWRQRATELQDKVDELYAWKQEAIAKHPDLQPVDPLLEQARKIVADMYRNMSEKSPGLSETAGRVEDGQFDNHASVLSAIAALRSVQKD